MSNHPIEIGLAIVFAAIAVITTWLIIDRPTLLPVVTPVEITEEPALAPNPSMKLTHKELRKMAQDQQIGSGKWRSRAKKIELVTALREANNG